MGRKRRSRWEGGGEEDKAINEAIASFTGSSATLTPEQQRQLKDQQEVGGGREGEGRWEEGRRGEVGGGKGRGGGRREGGRGGKGVLGFSERVSIAW